MSEKTNVMRILDLFLIKYCDYEYNPFETNGVEVAHLLGEDENIVFKTLVTISNGGRYYVFVVPVCCELDLKKAAKVTSSKSIEMIKQKDLLPLTGYIHGGCSPIGMKKLFPTFIHESALKYNQMCVSGGRCGRQIKIDPRDLIKLTNARTCDLIKE